MDRRDFLGAMGGIAFLRNVRADPAKVHRIGSLNFPSLRPAIKKMLLGAFSERGYVEGQNLHIEYRFGEPEQLPGMAAQLVSSGLELITCGSSGPVRALMTATRTVPVVAVDLETDPIAMGFAASLARPGGNLTGTFLDLPDFSAKRLEILKETMPMIKRVAALWDPALDRSPVTALERAAGALGLQLILAPVRSKIDLSSAFKNALRMKASAVMVMQSPRLDAIRTEILRLGSQAGMPIFALFGFYTAEGALLSYGPNVDEMTVRLAQYVDKILNGAKPSDLPIQTPERFDLVLNMRTAKQLGIAIPSSLPARADNVIH